MSRATPAPGGAQGLADALARQPERFAFDAAFRILMLRAGAADPQDAIRFESVPHLAFPGAEILGVSERDGVAHVVESVIGMTGPGGVLPRPYTELVTVTARERAPSLKAFLDLLAARFVGAYAMAGAKYRPARIAESGADRLGQVLLALTGQLQPGLADRLGAGPEALQHYAGLFAAHPRSADRLASLASDWLGRAVEVRQFAGAWLPIPEAERTALPRGRLPGSFCALGVTAVAGVRSWDVHARIVLVVGPLTLAAFEALLPGGTLMARFAALVRSFLGLETEFAINLVLRRGAVPPLRLAGGAGATARLGWNSWLTAPESARLTDPADALFAGDALAGAA